MSNMLEIARYIVDIQEEIVNISFNKKLVNEGAIRHPNLFITLKMSSVNEKHQSYTFQSA